MDRWEAFLYKRMNDRELLLYAQREYVAEADFFWGIVLEGKKLSAMEKQNGRYQQKKTGGEIVRR